MEMVDRALATDREQPANSVANARLGLLECLMLRGDSPSLFTGEITAHRVRSDKVTIGKALHQRRGAEAVRTVIAEVRFT